MKYPLLYLYSNKPNTIGYSQTSVEEEWALYFPQLLNYETISIDKIVKDNLGNLYLVGDGSVETGYKNVITKVIISSWIVEWSVYYDVAEI